VQCRCFQYGSFPLRSDIKGTELPPADILTTRKAIDCATTLPLRGGVEPWLMACWKVRVEFLLSVIERLFLSLTVEALQGKMCQNSLPSGGVGHLQPRFQGKGSSLGNIFWFLQN